MVSGKCPGGIPRLAGDFSTDGTRSFGFREARRLFLLGCLLGRDLLVVLIMLLLLLLLLCDVSLWLWWWWWPGAASSISIPVMLRVLLTLTNLLLLGFVVLDLTWESSLGCCCCFQNNAAAIVRTASTATTTTTTTTTPREKRNDEERGSLRVVMLGVSPSLFCRWHQSLLGVITVAKVWADICNCKIFMRDATVRRCDWWRHNVTRIRVTIYP